MKSILISILYTVARQYFDKDLFTRIENLVVSLLDSDAPGDERKKMVRAAVWEEWEDVRAIFIDTIVQVVLMKQITQ